MSRAAKIWFLTFLLFSVNLLAQQARIDSVRNQIPLLKGKEKVDALNSLTRGLMYATPDEAMDLANQAIHLSESISYDEGKVMSYINQGVILNGKSLYQEAEEVLVKAKGISETLNFHRGMAYANLSLVTLSMRRNDYARALELSFSGIEAAKKIKNADLEVSNLINIGSIKQSLKDYADAEKFLLDARKLVDSSAGIAEIRQGQINGSLGILSAVKKDYGSALIYFEEALNVFETQNSKTQSANVLLNMGYSYAQLGDFSNANNYYDQAEVIWIELKNERSLAIILKNRGEMMISAGEFELAISFLQQALKKEKFLDDIVLSEVYSLLSKANESLPNHERALVYYRKYISLKDSIAIRASEKNIARMTQHFEFQKLEADKEMQLQQIEIENLKIAKSKQLTLVIAVVLLMITFWALWNRNKLKTKLLIKEKDRLIAHQKIALQQHQFETEKEGLVAYAKGLLSSNKTLEKKALELEEKLDLDQNSNSDLDDLVEKMHFAVNGEKDWAAFVIYFEAVYPQFFSLIESDKQVRLTNSEQRLLALLKINLSNKEIAVLLNISSDSVIRAKYRLKQKLGFVETKELLGFLSDLV
ncbi:tetratricopeptide repeat protein [Roseivirga sp.]|uniref:tetratricopeptide repeat protein n=1 Tax=Roseivirga sp. TaxID=1964215 RepID=UPI003B8B3629